MLLGRAGSIKSNVVLGAVRRCVSGMGMADEEAGETGCDVGDEWMGRAASVMDANSWAASLSYVACGEVESVRPMIGSGRVPDMVVIASRSIACASNVTFGHSQVPAMTAIGVTERRRGEP